MEFRYGLDDRPPPLEWIFLGLQWFAVAVPSIIILGKIICIVGPAGACDPLIYLQKMFFLAALFMLVQIFLGHGLPLIVGPSTVILIGILSSPGAQPAALHTTILLGGLVLFVLAWTGLFGKIRRLFTRRVVAVVLLLIAFTLTPTDHPADHGLRRGTLLKRPVCLCPVPVDDRPAPVPGRHLARSTLILRVTVAGTLAWHVLGLGFAGAGLAGAGALFGPFFTGLTTALSFDPGLLAAFLICFVALAVNDIGSIESMNAFVGDGDKGGRLRRGIAVTGLANLAAGFLGIIGQVNYSLSPGVVASSRCLSRFALVLLFSSNEGGHRSVLPIGVDGPRLQRPQRDSRGVDGEELRKQIVAAAGSGDSRSITPVDLHYRVFGDTGVVWGYNIDIHKAKDGQGTVVKSQVTSIYSRTGGKWRRVCTHISAVPPAN